MSLKRKIPFGSEMDALDRARLDRAEVREQKLQARIAAANGVELTAWRGKTGRRYVATINPIRSPDAYESRDGVLLAVRRGADGVAEILAGRVCLVGAADVLDWAVNWHGRGATEIHFHGLADTDEARRAVIVDLTPPAPCRAAA